MKRESLGAETGRLSVKMLSAATDINLYKR
jgi:hypothetical protein